jgi:hypothetical protein
MVELLAPTSPRSAIKQGPERGPGRRRRVLVVVDEACTAPQVCAAIRAYADPEPVTAYVVAPAHDTNETRWYADEDAARADAMHRLRSCVTCLDQDGIRVDGTLGDPDPVSAIADALQVFDADEILLVTAPERPSSWLRPNVVDRARRTFAKPIYHAAMPTGRNT